MPANSRDGDSEGIVEPNWLRYKCSEEISEEDATMLGLYRLTDSQNEEYLRFVQILSGDR